MFPSIRSVQVINKGLAIALANGDPIHWYIYAPSGFNELNVDFISRVIESRSTYLWHYGDVIMNAMASLIIGIYLVVSSDGDQRKTSKLRVIGLCEENSPVTGEFPAQRASNADSASIWWRHHEYKRT